MKQELYDRIEALKAELCAISDDIYDHPEIGLTEKHASKLLTDWLEKQGFAVERGVGGIETAFRATYHRGEGGPRIGLLCEYDALPVLGHACGHQMQGPCILAGAEGQLAAWAVFGGRVRHAGRGDRGRQDHHDQARRLF